MQQKTHGFVAMDGVFVDFRQDCDLESKSADAWMICFFFALETPQWMEPQQHPLLLFGEGDLLREHCSYALTY